MKLNGKDHKLTFDEAVQWHREMWGWITEQIKDKDISPRSSSFKAIICYLKQKWCSNNGFEEIVSHCFACEYDDQMKHLVDNNNCIYCPFIWSANKEDFGENPFYCDIGIVTWTGSDPAIIANLKTRKKFSEEV